MTGIEALGELIEVRRGKEGEALVRAIFSE
jgi:hypothetical protein